MPCHTQAHEGADYAVCRFDPAVRDIRLFHADDDDEIYRHFNRLKTDLEAQEEILLFAMNAGMYDRERNPIGLYIENGVQTKKANTNDGPGNFHLKPNGVFWLWSEDGHRGAHVSTTEKYLEGAAHDVVQYATQSGPMLVIDGEVHPKFLVDSTSKKRRNGVGVTEDGDAVFVVADTPVTLHQFAGFFRDELGTPNALYLDGTITRFYAPGLDRNDPGVPMGPIVGVVSKK